MASVPLTRVEEDVVVLNGSRSEWLHRCEAALTDAGFRDVRAAPRLHRVTAAWRSPTLRGGIRIQFLPHPKGTEARVKATAAVDNLFALFRRPTATIIEKAVAALDAATPDPEPSP